MKRAAFHYDLPPDRIAAFPLADRDRARLLVCSRSEPDRVEHRCVRDLPELLRCGDIVVLNETRVLPHRLVGRRESGGRVECLILSRNGRECTGFLKPSRKLGTGERIAMEGGALTLRVLGSLGGGKHRFALAVAGGRDADIADVLSEVGRAPLPPYLKREAGEEDVGADRARYQTVFAREPGAVAAPTAGLHFTHALLERLAGAGIETARVVLHVGEGTFEPIRTERIEDHRMHRETYSLPRETVGRIEAARSAGGRVICIGTTSARVLESCADDATGRLVAGDGATELFLYPGNGPRYLDGLLTNFHLPESTLLLLVASMLGRERTLGLYELAIAEGYRFYSFGDAMLVLP